MPVYHTFAIFLLFLTFGCSNTLHTNRAIKTGEKESKVQDIFGGALLLTDFSTLEDLNKILKIEYSGLFRKKVRMSHSYKGHTVSCNLQAGISEKDLEKAQDSGFLRKCWIGIRSPYAAMHRKDLKRIVILARRRRVLFGEGDVAFYDLSEKIKNNISPYDTLALSKDQLGEKGYFNSFNHITAQALMTSIFSASFADFIADIHELGNMPELIHGQFTEDQLGDRDNGPVDNYLDMINNAWGQELGEKLKNKYSITRETHWTPELLANYLNDIQRYYSRVFFLGFKAFKSSDDIVIRFSNKLNKVLTGDMF